VTAADYDRVLRLYRKHSRDQKQPLYRAYIDACERIEALEALIAEELNPNNCVDAANADLAEEIHKRMDEIR
jgi:hypothetical protein